MRITNDEIRARIMEMHDAGHYTFEIAREVDIPSNAVCRIIRSRGGSPKVNRGKMSQDQKDLIFKLFSEGRSAGSIAREVGVGRQSVVDYMAVHHGEKFKSTVVRSVEDAEYIIEELEFLVGTDYTERLCERIGKKPKYIIETFLPRYGREDLADRLRAHLLDDYPVDQRTHSLAS